MDNHLFKLKKDGKTVGYARIMPSIQGDFHLYVVKSHRKTLQRWRASSRKCIEADSIHPFVTKDKHGKDVFAGDEITFVPVEGFGTEKRQRVEVYFCNRRLAFCARSKAWDIPIKHNCLDIELIEDKDNG